MTVDTASSVVIDSIHQRLNRRIQRIAEGDWCHQVELNENGELVPAENLSYRISVLRHLFNSLFRNQTVLVLNEASGLYPIMIKRAGATRVTANNVNPDRCALMMELSSFSRDHFEVLNQSMALFHASQIFVDFDHEERHNFLFAQNFVWDVYNAAEKNFSDVVEACAHYVTDGLVFDWTDAEWADPPPPKDYTRESFHSALRERFEYVLACNEWLTVALGKLPIEVLDGETAVNGA
jgi:hypothetical protein